MLIVETYLNLSPGRGIGLFAKESIKKGSLYWVRNENFDCIFTPSQIKEFNELVVDFIKKYGFQETNGNWYLCNDHARFTNHSKEPNSRSFFDKNGLVLHNIITTNIQPGEEIYCDYSEICTASKDGIDFPNL